MLDSDSKIDGRLGIADWATAAVLGAIALCVYLCSLSDYAYPGDPAMLTSAWSGLEKLPEAKYPLMTWFAGLFGSFGWIPPVCGAVSTFLVFLLVTRYVRKRMDVDFVEASAASISRLGGIAAALVFAFNPSVLSSATHPDPRLFAAAWALVALSLLAVHERAPKALAWLVTIVVGTMVGMGGADSVALVALLPLFVVGIWASSAARGGRGYGTTSLFLAAFLVAFIWTVAAGCGGFDAYYGEQKEVVKLWIRTDGTFAVFLFAILPSAVALFSSSRAFTGGPTRMKFVFHAVMTLVSIIVIATPFAPSSVMGRTGYSPVICAFFVAFMAGYLVAFWRSLSVSSHVANESVDDSASTLRSHRTSGLAMLVAYAAVLAIAVSVGALSNFDSDAGAFADVVADRVVADMDGRTWLVTDGTLDSHLRLAAKRAGKELNLVCLQRDGDREYVEELAALLEEKGLGTYADRLRKYGILRFIQDWLSSDAEIASRLVVWGAPDLWRYAPGLRPVPEFLFYGGDPARAVVDLDGRRKFADEVLFAEEGWGSYRLHEVEDAMDLRRLNLRRHLGFVTCNAGCAEHAEGRKLDNSDLSAEAAPHYDKAFDCYELVLRKIDADNVSALFNELELLERRNRKALSRRKEIIGALEAMKADESRRYDIHRLGLFYGYLMNPEFIMKQGFGEIRRGDYDQGVSQIRRAMDLVPMEQGAWAQLNVLAPLYASGGTVGREKAEKIYTSELERNPTNRVALVGLARLAMLNGDNEKAVRLLEQATKDAGDDPGSYIDIATLRIMRGELDAAKAILLRATDAAPNNIKAWSLLATVDMQMLDALRGEQDEARREIRRKELEDEINGLIVPRMEKIDPDDPQVASVKAFLRMRKGGREDLAAACDALKKVSDSSGSQGNMSDIVLGLDIRLNDKEDAEERALEKLRDDPKDQLANYVMGSVSLGRGEIDKAEEYLRLAVAGKKQNVMALNDLAEVLRRREKYPEAEHFARAATVAAPDLYVVWETLGSILLDAGSGEDVPEAERCIQKACDMSRDEKGNPTDPRMLISLARVQLKLGKTAEAKRSLRIVGSFRDSLEPEDIKKLQEVHKLAK